MFALEPQLRGARRTDPSTSHDAARMSELREIDRVRVLFMHYAFPSGLTDFELGGLVGRQQTSAGKRRGELRDEGYIEATNERRKAPSGASAIVWRITPYGKTFAERLRGNE